MRLKRFSQLSKWNWIRNPNAPVLRLLIYTNVFYDFSEFTSRFSIKVFFVSTFELMIMCVSANQMDNQTTIIMFLVTYFQNCRILFVMSRWFWLYRHGLAKFCLWNSGIQREYSKCNIAMFTEITNLNLSVMFIKSFYVLFVEHAQIKNKLYESRKLF